METSRPDSDNPSNPIVQSVENKEDSSIDAPEASAAEAAKPSEEPAQAPIAPQPSESVKEPVTPDTSTKSQNTPLPIQKPRHSIKWILALTAVVALLVLWLISDRHHNRYFVVIEGQSAHIERGFYFPVGSSAFSPSRAYEAFQLPAGFTAQSSEALTLKELNAQLLNLYLNAADAALRDMQSSPDLAEDLLVRANKLDNVTREDEQHILESLGHVAFRRGLAEITGVQASLERALEQFKIASMRCDPSDQGPKRWVEALSRINEEFRKLTQETGLNPDKVLNQAEAKDSAGRAPEVQAELIENKEKTPDSPPVLKEDIAPQADPEKEAQPVEIEKETEQAPSDPQPAAL